MAIPFYNQADQDIYTGGEHFIPQQNYRLNYTAPPSIANAPSTTGITNTQAANPYLYPQGGGGGGGDNYFGPNATTKMFSKNVYDADTGTWNMQDIKGYWTPSGYKTKDEKNIEHAGWLTGDPKEGDIEATEMDFSNFPSPLNFMRTKLRNWKKNREIKRQEKIVADKIVADKITADKVVGDAAPGSTDTSGWDSPGYSTRGGFTGKADPTSGDVRGHHGAAQGGRIGLYAGGDPEEPAENIFNFMQDQGIPHSEQVEGDPFRMRIEELMGKGLTYEDAYDIAEMEFQDLFAEGSEQDQGIASLV